MREFAMPLERFGSSDRNLTDHLVRGADLHPALAQCRELQDGAWRDIPRSRFLQDIRGVAKGLIAVGIEPGDRVAIMSHTSYDWTIMDFAILFAGGVTVPIYETSSADQMQWVVENSGAVAVVLESEELEDRLRTFSYDVVDLRHVWRFDAGAISDLTERGADVSDSELEERRAIATADTVATIIYTSGTTGRPKGCTITHGNIMAVVEGMDTGGVADAFTVGTSTLLFLPLAHVFGRAVQFMSTRTGTTLGHTSDIRELVDSLALFQPTFLLSVPRVFEKIFNSSSAQAAASGKSRVFDAAVATAIAHSQSQDDGGPGLLLQLRQLVFDRLVASKIRDSLGGNVTMALSAGAPIDSELWHFFNGIGIRIVEAYGMTENFGPATFNDPNALRVGTVGQPLPGTAIRIADDGEVLMKGPHVFAGYWENPEATAEVLDSDGWLHTGDIGELDDDGYLSITGRKKDLIVTAGGKNVAPAVLEDRMAGNRLVGNALVVGDNKPFIATLVTLDHSFLPTWLKLEGRPQETTVEDLIEDPKIVAEIQSAVDHANEAVSKAESIRKFEIIPMEFTIEGGQLTPSMKLKRAVVAEELTDEIEALYT